MEIWRINCGTIVPKTDNLVLHTWTPLDEIILQYPRDSLNLTRNDVIFQIKKAC